MDRSLLVKLLLGAFVVCIGVALLITQGWGLDSGNAVAWALAGVLAYAVASLVETL